MSNESYTNDMDSMNFELTTNIGLGCDVFELKISVEKFMNECQAIANIEQKPCCWLSYRFFGQVFQSETFCSSAQSFAPMVHSFRIRSSLSELTDYFRDKKKSTLRVHVCTIGQVLGTTLVDLSPLFGAQTSGDSHCYEGRTTHGEYFLRPTNKEGVGKTPRATLASLLITLCLHKKYRRSNTLCQSAEHQSSLAAKSLSISSQTDLIDKNVDVVDPASSCQQERDNVVFLPMQKLLEKKEQELKIREAQIYEKEKEVYESVTALEKKRCEWEQWRHQEEVKWHEKLRNKEAATMRTIEERLCNIEKDRLRSVETSRSEYEKLEGKLRKALLEVEAKERQLKEVEVNQQNEQKRKMAELDLREKLSKEELKHAIEIEASSRYDFMICECR